MRYVGFVALPLAVASLTGALAANPLPSFIDQQRSINHIPGIAVVVVRDGRAEHYLAGAANLEWGAPVTPDTRFQLASVTKLFTGILVMRLVQAGKLDLDRSVRSYVPEAPATWQPITIRMLASHTSGIPDGDENWAPKTFSEVLDWAKDKPLEWAPGSKARYGRADFSILGLVIERASGLAFEEALRRYVLIPAKLDSTGYPHLQEDGLVRTAPMMSKRSTVYHWNGRQSVYEFLYPEATYPAGGLYSTIGDMQRLMIALQNGRFLHREHLLALTTPTRLNDGTPGPFAIGWVAHTHHGMPVAGHTGGPALADVSFYPDRKVAVVVLQNQHKLYPWLSGAIVDKVAGLPPIQSVKDSSPSLTVAALNALRRNAAGLSGNESWSRTAREEFLPWFETDGRTLVRSMGTPKAAVLVGDKQGPDGRERTYSVSFSNVTARWKAITNKEELLEAITPTDE